MASRVERTERAGQVADKLIGARKSDLRIVHAKAAHALQQADAIGTEISRFGCCIPSRRLVSNSSTFLVVVSCIRFHSQKHFLPSL